MNFIEQFKIGDVICSNNFHSGILMIVDFISKKDQESNGFSYREYYHCSDLFNSGLAWRAYEKDLSMDKPYAWRLATNKDYVDSLELYIDPTIFKLAGEQVRLSDNGLILSSTNNFVWLDIKDTKKLKAYLNKWIL